MERKGNLLLWGQHELAGSRIHCGVECPVFNTDGIQVSAMFTQKEAGSFKLRSNDAWLLIRYWTNSHYPSHRLIQIPEQDGPVVVLAFINSQTTYLDIESLPIPRGVRDYILRDVFPQQLR